MTQLADHLINTGKVITGGAATATTAYVSVDMLTKATEYATLAASLATCVYFVVSTVIAVLKYRKGRIGKH